jgi:hypothetical protein
MSWGEKSQGTLEVDGKKIDYIGVTGVSSQYGTNYYFNCIVNVPDQKGIQPIKKTTMTVKKNPPFWGKPVDIDWKGDPYLAQRLNLDYSLKYRLLQGSLDSVKGGITIIPEPAYGYVKIKTNYQNPSPELFEVLDSVARHVKTAT